MNRPERETFRFLRPRDLQYISLFLIIITIVLGSFLTRGEPASAVSGPPAAGEPIAVGRLVITELDPDRGLPSDDLMTSLASVLSNHDLRADLELWAEPDETGSSEQLAAALGTGIGIARALEFDGVLPRAVTVTASVRRIDSEGAGIVRFFHDPEGASHG